MSDATDESERWSKFRRECRRIIFQSTRWDEKLFDVLLILAIVASVLAVMLESVADIRLKHGAALYATEWVFTILFTIEYATRVYVAGKPRGYIFSFFGIVDLLSILPSYIGLMYPGVHYLMLFRSLRVLRVFRVLKMARFVGEADLIYRAMRASGRKIVVFLAVVVAVTLIVGSIMYLIEGPQRGFTSIPKSVYWAIVTLTTVGYGDIAPQTPLGQLLASLLMITGYGIIAVPTGIVTAEITLASRPANKEATCKACGAVAHRADAKYCAVCGEALP